MVIRVNTKPIFSLYWLTLEISCAIVSFCPISITLLDKITKSFLLTSCFSDSFSFIFSISYSNASLLNNFLNAASHGPKAVLSNFLKYSFNFITNFLVYIFLV
ncbi:putative membrane protein [Rickettsia parkeri str. Tate's Hell]|uniref:Membrane protein n=1 Tax=Rickettsia parkeri str. Tate's Hell TaxID=1359189 RepID=A0ABR5DS09_RICPA|nr:putative membrane protein [Rickettsia parkeri str. Tate's Hell]